MIGRRKALALLLAGLAGGSLAELLRRDRGAVWERTFSKDASAAAIDGWAGFVRVDVDRHIAYLVDPDANLVEISNVL